MAETVEKSRSCQSNHAFFWGVTSIIQALETLTFPTSKGFNDIYVSLVSSDLCYDLHRI